MSESSRAKLIATPFIRSYVGLLEVREQQRMTSFTYGAKPTRVLASARLNSREAAREITAGIARGHVRGRCRLFPEVVVKNRVKTTSPNNMKGHDGYFHRLIMSDDVDMLQMACDAATRHTIP